jgi:hypothetical protein
VCGNTKAVEVLASRFKEKLGAMEIASCTQTHRAFIAVDGWSTRAVHFSELVGGYAACGEQKSSLQFLTSF